MIDVTIAPTNYCDRGCAHCMCDSTASGEAIRPTIARLLPLELSMMKGEKILTISGGGEPVLWPWLPELVWELTGDWRNRDIVIVTSGCRDECDSGYRTMMRLGSIRCRRISPNISFTPYNKSSEERLRFSLPILQKISGFVAIKVTADFAQSSVTQEVLRVLDEMGYELKMLTADLHYSDRIFRSMRRKKLVEEEVDYAYHYLTRPTIIEEEYRKGHELDSIMISPQTLTIRGRGRSLYKGGEGLLEASQFTHVPSKCSEFRKDEKETLLIDARGGIYPCCGGLYGVDWMKLGELGKDRLWRALGRKPEVMQEALRRFLTYPAGLEENLCDMCRQP